MGHEDELAEAEDRERAHDPRAARARRGEMAALSNISRGLLKIFTPPFTGARAARGSVGNEQVL